MSEECISNMSVDCKPNFPIDIIVKQETHPKNGNEHNNSSDSDDDDFHEALERRKSSLVIKDRPAFESAYPICTVPQDPQSRMDRIETEILVRADLYENNDVIMQDDDDEDCDLDPERILDSVLIDEENLEEDGDEEFIFCFPTLDAAREQANIFARKVWSASWKATHFYSLPEWLQDNDFLHAGHRPPLPSFAACFKSIFRVHTETGNIWTHMIGCVAFIGMAAYFLTRPHREVQWLDKIVFLPFFVGAVACLGLSFTFHTLHCHSERVGKLFSKLDYVGITLLIMGSFVPWLYYGFYCRLEPQIAYITAIFLLGICCIVVSLWDKFSQPKFRPLRAGLFMGLGLSGVIPCGHYFIVKGFWSSVYEASMGWLVLMAALYISGALFYAFRIPERFFPGKCDIMFQSHQIFHLLVVAAAFVHYHGVTEMAVQRLSGGTCEEVTDKQLFDKLLAYQKNTFNFNPEQFTLNQEL